MRQLIAEVRGVFRCLEIPASDAPIGDIVNYAVHQLADARLPLGPSHAAMEIFADNNIGSRLRPVGWHFHVILLKDDGAFVVPNGSGPQLPRNVVVGRSPRFQLLGEELREADSLALGHREGLLGSFVFQVYDFTAAKSDAGVCHLFLLCNVLVSGLPSITLLGVGFNTIVTKPTSFCGCL